MTTAHMGTLLDDARRNRLGVGAFNVVLLEHAEAIVTGAGSAGLPVVLQLSENCIRYHGALAPLLRGAIELAEAATVPVVVHLDHIETESIVRDGLRMGVRSVMFDASRSDFADNVARTRDITAYCHKFGASVEAELGEIGGKDGAHAPGVRTDPASAVRFVAATGVDSLAVAVGTEHAMTSRTAEVDLGLIAKLAADVPVPLVLHGSSGLSDESLSAAVAAGMSKINISTHLNGLFTRAIRSRLELDPDMTDPRQYVREGRMAVATEVDRLLRLLANRATLVAP